MMNSTLDFASEAEAYAIALEAYVYGYPRVELARRIHNETHRVTSDQMIYAPPNRFFYFSRLARPGDGRVIKAPNNDTLYASAYLDLAPEPVVLRVPEMDNRVYVALIVDARGSVVRRLSRSVSGAGNCDYCFAGPRFHGVLPSDVKSIEVSGDDLWLLMRVATSGDSTDEKIVSDLLRCFRLEPISSKEKLPQSQDASPVADVPVKDRLEPFGKLEFFHTLAGMLERNPVPLEDQGLQNRWSRIGLFAGRFDENELTTPVRSGIVRAIKDAEQIVAAAQFGIANRINGWNYSMVVGRAGIDWALNAAIARGGYGNLPEDSVYYQRTQDSSGDSLTGERSYRMTFPPDSLPPVNAFWSITAYDLETFDLFENEAKRYSLGDRTAGVTPNPDGSLTLAIQSEMPSDPILRKNWLPVNRRPFYLIIRTYDPATQILQGKWAPPDLVRDA